MVALAIGAVAPGPASAACTAVVVDTTISVSTDCVSWSGGNLTINAALTGNSGSAAISATTPGGSNILTNNSAVGTPSAPYDYGLSNMGTIDTITNNSGASFQGSSGGIRNMGTIGAFGNDGTINGAEGNGIWNVGTIGPITNTGTINGETGSGIWTSSSITSITNSGTISGGDGIWSVGNIGTIDNSGTIDGGDGLFLGGGSVNTITNSGTISSTGYGIMSGITITTLSNTIDGEITGNFAILNSGTITTFDNAGDITGVAYGINNAGTLIGTFINSGTITGNFGLNNQATAGMGQISNTGTISGTAYGVYNSTTIDAIINGDGATAASISSIYNTSVIGANGAAEGIYNQANASIGTITNTGTIHGENGGGNLGIGIYNDGAITTLTNDDTISGTDIAIYNNSGTITTLTNNDTISSAFGIITNTSIGTLTNAGTITATAGQAIENGGTIGTLNNSGTISGVDVGVSNSADITSITNSGTITGNHGIFSSGAVLGSITNTGTITGTTTGIWSYSTVDTIVNGDGSAAASISVLYNNGAIGANSASYGIYNYANATIDAITNEGTISGTSYGMYNAGTINEIDSNGVGTITISSIYNSGTIGANGAGIAIDNQTISTIGTITNTGTIGGTDYNISNLGTITTITNTGTFSSGDYSIENYGTITTLNNSGTISGANYGIDNYGTIGTITNSGTISGGVYAIFSDNAITNPISNTGTIEGNIEAAQDLIITGAGGTLTSGTITVDNLTFNSGAVQLLDSDIIVGSGSGTVANNGRIQVDLVRTITGNYTQASTARLTIGAADSTTYGNLTISGNATMTNGRIVIVSNGSPLTLGETFTVVSTDGTADYSGVTATAAGFRTTVSTEVSGGYDNLIVTLSGAGYTYAELGQAEGGGAAPYVGAALDQIQADGNADFAQILTALDDLGAESLAAEQTAIKQLAPSQLGPQVVVANFGINKLADAVSQHQRNLLLSQNEKGSIGRSAGSEYQSGIFWGQISGGIADRQSDSSSDGYSQHYYGLTVGSDVQVSRNTTVGLSLGWVRSSANGIDGLAGDHLSVNDIQLTAYGTHRFDKAFVNGMLGVAYNLYNQSRAIAFLNEKATASYDGLQYVGKIDGGYDFTVNNVTLTPLAGLQAVITNNSGYTESGAGAANVSVGSQTFNTFTTTLGGRAITEMKTAYGTLTPEVKLNWVHDLSRGVISTYAMLGGVKFTTATPRMASDGAQIGLSLALKTSDNFKIRVEYDGDIRSGYASHSGQVKASWRF